MSWRARAGSPFETENRPVEAVRGMVVANHPLASAAGAEMLAAGGNAVDAAVAALFALTVVEPMMVGVLGAGHAQLRLASGLHTVIDGYTTAPAAATPAIYRPRSDSWPDYMETVERENTVGLRAVGVPGTLAAWCEMLTRFGALDLETVTASAIRHAEHGFRVTGYLAECLAEAAPDLARFPASARVFLPAARRSGAARCSCRATTRRRCAPSRPVARRCCTAARSASASPSTWRARAGSSRWPTSCAIARSSASRCGAATAASRWPAVLRPPGGGLHLIQILNLLEGYDVAGLGFGTVDGIHLLAEALKIAFADRAAATGDPVFVDVPVARLTSKEYAAVRRGELDMAKAGAPSPAVGAGSAHTTHVTVADVEGNVVAATQTINSLFGSRAMVPGTGMLLNNTMALFDPHPGHALSVAPGKRMTSSMAPTILLRDGRPWLALGLPGGARIFASVLQAIVNVVDHGMSLQEAVEAPRVWTQGQELEVEAAIGDEVRQGLAARGHHVVLVAHVAGGMGAIAFEDDGTLLGASCWRADGTPVGLGGGYARPGIRFWPDRRTPPEHP